MHRNLLSIDHQIASSRPKEVGTCNNLLGFSGMGHREAHRRWNEVRLQASLKIADFIVRLWRTPRDDPSHFAGRTVIAKPERHPGPIIAERGLKQSDLLEANPSSSSSLTLRLPPPSTVTWSSSSTSIPVSRPMPGSSTTRRLSRPAERPSLLRASPRGTVRPSRHAAGRAPIRP